MTIKTWRERRSELNPLPKSFDSIFMQAEIDELHAAISHLVQPEAYTPTADDALHYAITLITHGSACSDGLNASLVECLTARLEQRCVKAITALKEALAQHVQPVQPRPINCGSGYCSCVECLFEPVQP